MSQVSKTPTLVKPAEVGELQHKVVVDKEVKKYKPKSIFADYKKKQEKIRKDDVAKAKRGDKSLTPNRIDKILQTGKFGGD